MQALFSLPERLDSRAFAAAVCFLFVPLGGVVAISSGGYAPLSLAGLLAGAVLGLICVRWPGPWANHVLAALLIVQAAQITAQMQGHPWQVDTHILYFAMLAIVATLRSVRALLLACGVTLVHLLLVGQVWPGLVWPPSEPSGALRGLLHAVVVMLEGGVLVMAILRRRAAETRVAQTAERLDTERRIAEDARREAEDNIRTTRLVIDAVRVALSRLAGRDMTCSISAPFPAAYEVMRQDFNTTVETLREAFLNANDLGKSFTRDAQSLAEEIIGHSGKTAKQVQRLEGMSADAAKLRELLTATVEQAHKAAEAAGQARGSAEHGGEVTAQAIRAMRGIEDSSREISQIVDLIDDVSFQTNLLALNAGVEAARAGQSGKGFAVVAAEVRHLAQSTSEAAAGIKKLIRRSSDQVKTGAGLVDAVGQRLAEIQTQIARASALTDAISEGNGAQAEGLNRLHAQVGDADAAAHEAQKTAERLAARARKMTIASKKLSCDIEAFTFTEDDLLRGMSEA
ncbi:methyl-accepting chemotaxis protein [Maliponia aquimaris]|uniref:Methyl-accepting chemotaxis protein II n=1 Tax=Maliponia aquimaris TaxID=1673631 RepID=A0A238L6Y2_9RHOB|nr:methyl-accepting chemotaxis protein [Maliponia aquimaris]SMX50600.1 Methyl-accepting chemotaxis protein II [Maliponia aquimaris]